MAQYIDHARLQLEGVKIERRKELGRGSYGFVIEVSVNGTTCAAKVIHEILVEQVANKDFEATEMMFLNECTNSSRMLHPNVVQFLGVYYPSPKDKLPWLIMEMMYTNLTSLIEKYETTDLPLHIKLSILVDTSQGLQYLHSKDVIHRDLSSNNILLTKHMVAKIADFGKAKVILKNTKQTEAPGTQAFMAPETLHDPAIYGKPLDVFSLSCVTAHVISMQWPLPSSPMQKDEQTGKSVMRSEVQRREKYLTKMTDGSPLKQLTVKCLQNDPDNRPTIEEVTRDLQNIKATIWESMKYADGDILELLNSLSQQEQLANDYRQQIIEKEQQKAELQSKHERECNAALKKELSECRKDNDKFTEERNDYQRQVEQLEAENGQKERCLRAIIQQAGAALNTDSNSANSILPKPSINSEITTPISTSLPTGTTDANNKDELYAGGNSTSANSNSTTYVVQSKFSNSVSSGTVVKRITTTATKPANTKTNNGESSSQYSKFVNLLIIVLLLIVLCLSCFASILGCALFIEELGYTVSAVLIISFWLHFCMFWFLCKKVCA